MQATAKQWVIEDEYLAMENASPEKHEYFNGEVWAMAGGSPKHAQLAFNVAGALSSRLRGKPCRGAGSDQRVRVEGTGMSTYPDVLVVCPPERYDERDPNALLNPRVIIEVLSPSTENYDRSGKFEHFKRIAELTDYLLISQDRVLVEHFRRGENGAWLLRSYLQRADEITLEDIEVTLPLEEIYERLELPTGLPPARADQPRISGGEPSDEASRETAATL
jgi:Uma2 family endonuclease